MAKKTQKTVSTPAEAPKPAVRRTRSVKAANAEAKPAPARRVASRRQARPAAVANDRGMSAVVAVEVMAPVAAAEPSHAEIATRAYFIHLRRNGAPGNPDHDWLLALSELRHERGLI